MRRRSSVSCSEESDSCDELTFRDRMTTRRQLLFAIGATAALPAIAQQRPRLRRVAYLSGGSAESNAPRLAAFREGMAALRWTEGRNYVIDGSYANAAAQALDGLADELVASRPDVILTPADEVTMRVAKRG
jgi:DNA-binding LacI/PurR family transcriptional regulator